MIHSNEHYEIKVDDTDSVKFNGGRFTEYYEVTNKETHVVEFRSPSLPEAIIYAENASQMLTNRPWEWAKRMTEEAAAASGPVN